jgi:hypothetical protein
LNKLFRVARVIILVDVADLEFVWLLDLSEWSRQSTESTFFHRSNVLRYRAPWWGWCSKPETHPIFNNVAEVIPFTVVFPHGEVLSDALPCIMLEQTVVWAC